MVEMLKCSSLGTVKGGPAVEAPLQTPRELKSASTGVGGTAVLDRGHSLCQEGTGEPPREQMSASLRGFSVLPTSPTRLLIIPRTAMPGPHRSRRSSWKLSVAAQLPAASFLWVPWAALMARETAHHTYFKHQCNGLWPIEG